MQPDDSNNQKKECFLEKYPYLEPLLKHYVQTYDRTSITMNDYIIFLNRIVLKNSKTSDDETVDNIKNFFFILIKNSIRMNMDSIIFKTLSYFIKEGFDLFISSLKSTKDVNRKDFIIQLFSKLDNEKIAKSFNLDNTEVANELKLVTLKKAIKEKKFTFKQKIGSYIFLFFRNFIEQNDIEIKNELFKFIKEKDWKDFYKIYEKYKSIDDFDRKLNKIFNKESLDKNEMNEKLLENNQYNSILEKDVTNLKENISFDKEALENKEDSQNSGKQSTEMINGNSDQKSSEMNDGNNDQIITEMNYGNIVQKNTKMNEVNIEQINSEINDTDKNKVLDNKQLTEKYNDISVKYNEVKEDCKQLGEKFSQLMELYNKQNNEVKSLKEKINVLSDKLDLSILINNISTQRNGYKKTLDILIKYLNKEIKLNLVLTGDDIWKQTKIVIDKISDCKLLTKENRQKTIDALKGLLFCKDYVNCLTHGKSIFSEELDNYYKNKNEVQIISTASYENMKNATKMFFNQKVNKGEMQIINSLLSKKCEKWKNNNEIDYTIYLSRNEIHYEILLKHFSFAENIVEGFGLNGDIDNELLKK